MEEKYYTPTIEEFHVGFEVHLENIENAQIGSYIITKSDMLSATHDEVSGMFDIIESAKVKYLDREDIESLGWEHDQTTKDGAVFYIGILMDEKQWMLTCFNAILRKGEDYTYLSIIDVNDKYNSSNSFQGIVKNKSELKLLMNMLNIK